MNKTHVNTYAKRLKEFGMDTPEGKEAWGLLVGELLTYTEKKASYFANKNIDKIRIEVDTLVSEALCEGIRRSVVKWDEELGDFTSRYGVIMRNIFIECIRKETGTNSRKALVTATSTNTPLDEGITLEDTLVDKNTIPEKSKYGEVVDNIFYMYSREHGEDKAHFAKLIMTEDNVAHAVCRFFGESTYNSTLRKRVERARKHFITYCQANKNFLLA